VARLSLVCARRNLELVRLKSGLQPVYATIMISGVVLVVWQGSERVIAGMMTVGGFIAYLELFLRFVNRGHRIPQLVNSLQSGAAAYARLCPLLAPALPPGQRVPLRIVPGGSRGGQSSRRRDQRRQVRPRVAGVA